MAAACDFRELIGRIRDGDEGALFAFVLDYGDFVRRHARRELAKRRIDHLFPPTEVLNSVIFSLAKDGADARWTPLTNEELLRRLAGMVRNKCRERSRREHAQCRDARRVTAAPVESLALPAPAREPDFADDVVDRYQAALARLPELDRRLLLRHQELRGWQELAAEAGMTPEAVRKRCERALARLKRELGVGEGGNASSPGARNPRIDADG